MIKRMFSAAATCRFGRIAPLAQVGLLLVTGCTGGEVAGESERLRSLREQRAMQIQSFHAIQQGIRRVQAEAVDEPGVRQAQESFYAEVRKFVSREEPASLELLDRAREIGGALDRLSGPMPVAPDHEDQVRQDEQDRRQAGAELVATERALRPLLERAMADSAVNTAFLVLRDSLMSAIVRIEPTAATSLDRMNEISRAVAELDREIAEEQRSR